MGACSGAAAGSIGNDARHDNLGTLQSPHNPHPVWCSATNQRAGGGGACAGAGNGDGGGAAAAGFGFFGLFGRIMVREGFGGGPAG